MLQQELTRIFQILSITFIETYQNVDEMLFYVWDCRQAHTLLTFYVHKLRLQPVHTRFLSFLVLSANFVSAMNVAWIYDNNRLRIYFKITWKKKHKYLEYLQRKFEAAFTGLEIHSHIS